MASKSTMWRVRRPRRIPAASPRFRSTQSGRCRGRPRAPCSGGIASTNARDPDAARRPYTRTLLRRRGSGFGGFVTRSNYREFRDAIRFGDFADAETGLAQITHHRTYARLKFRPRPSAPSTRPRALSATASSSCPATRRLFRTTMTRDAFSMSRSPARRNA
jgi:hypothetical protein